MNQYQKDVAVASTFVGLIAAIAITIGIGINQSNQSYRECIKTDRTDCILILNINAQYRR